MFDTNLNHFKSVFAHKFFVAPADQNYFLARFTKIYGMHEEFWWQSLQAIEKLLKAGLILNGISVKKGYGHDIEKLWDMHLETFGGLAVDTLLKPEKLTDRLWGDRPLRRFILRVNRMGHPDSRYGLVSYSNSEDDIFKLDQLVCELRRRTIGLDWIVGENWKDECLLKFDGQPYRNVIEQLPSHQIRKMKIPKGGFETVGADLEDIHYSWNFAFPRAAKDHEKQAPASVAPAVAGFGNSYLHLLWESLNETAIAHAAQEHVRWLLDNVFVGREAEKEFRKFLKNGETSESSATEVSV
jgi:hypothetical protein